MRGKVRVEQLLFDPKIERTICRNLNKNRKKKQRSKGLDLEKSSISKQRITTKVDNNTNNNGNNDCGTT